MKSATCGNLSKESRALPSPSEDLFTPLVAFREHLSLFCRMNLPEACDAIFAPGRSLRLAADAFVADLHPDSDAHAGSGDWCDYRDLFTHPLRHAQIAP